MESEHAGELHYYGLAILRSAAAAGTSERVWAALRATEDDQGQGWGGELTPEHGATFVSALASSGGSATLRLLDGEREREGEVWLGGVTAALYWHALLARAESAAVRGLDSRRRSGRSAGSGPENAPPASIVTGGDRVKNGP